MEDRTAACQAWIATDKGTRKCSRKATHLMPSGDKGVCTQHARSYDVPKARARGSGLNTTLTSASRQ
jgi:hypothetical protein